MWETWNWWQLAAATAGGMALGLVFFAGLWWTVQRLPLSRVPHVWVFSSYLIRTSVVIVGFWGFGRHDWKCLLAGVLGFLLARQLVIRHVFADSAAIHPQVNP